VTQHIRKQPVLIKILGKDYRIACFEDEQDSLIEAAFELDQQMRKIRDTGTVNGTDRIAVMAALNLSHELRQFRNRENTPQNEVSDQLTHLRQKIEKVLESA